VAPHLAAESRDPSAAVADASAPRTQWQLRSVASPTNRVTFTAGLFYVGPLVQLAVDGYTRADVSGEWRFSRQLAVMATGQNLLDAAHSEFATATSLLLATQVPRSASLRLRWTSR
jgi:outer membrane receptor protein involved in Fe transport